MVLASPEKPLKILTLDGGGLQAISTLLILDRLLETIQDLNQAPKKPRPCDVFDVIGGIGAGGWLALLLGRFRLETKTCLSEWYKLLDCIVPHSRGQRWRRRVFQNTYFDKNLLVERVHSLTDLYGTGETLLDPIPSHARCKYVFVAAQRGHDSQKGNEYSLFRSYKIPDDPAFRSGASDPETFSIASAFGVTGAAKYFSKPWKERTMTDDKTSFFDITFPRPHNVTLPALEEMWTLFGDDVPISVIVNIGPGLPTHHDHAAIARAFSFGLKKPRLSTEPFIQHSPEEALKRPRSSDRRSSEKSIKIIAHQHFYAKLLKAEKDHEANINEQLRSHYSPKPPYYHLSLDIAPPGAAQNDTQLPDPILDATEAYCGSNEAVRYMEEISRVVEIRSPEESVRRTEESSHVVGVRDPEESLPYTEEIRPVVEIRV